MTKEAMPRAASAPTSPMLAAIALVGLCASSPSFAQPGGCRLLPDDREPSVKVLRCGDDLTVRAARDTEFQVMSQPGQDKPSGVWFDSGAVMIEFKPGAAQRNFQILTPHAIAAVRGTTWAVEVKAGQTATLAISGAVEVKRPGARQGVMLRDGEGVDVVAGTAPLTVKRWGAPRVRTLLARFGQ